MSSLVLAERSVRVLPCLNYPNYTAISLTVGGNLYVIRRFPRPSCTKCFEALIYGHPSQGKQFGRPDWYWHHLPPPPYVFEKGYQLPPSNIRSYTAIGDSKICISAKDVGTYSFDTASRAWSKEGDWLLPFTGLAEYVPEHDLWFGLSYADSRLCAADNLSDTSELNQPTLRHEWDTELDPPKEWAARMAYAVHLGSSKFCIARFFERALVEEPQMKYGFDSKEYERFVVLTGVEVERDGMAGIGGELRMIIHRSKRYMLTNKVMEWVL
ncbi:hypothetical protein ACP4OV_009905 [Aristida adscensionis]